MADKSPIYPQAHPTDNGHLPASGELNPLSVPHDDPLLADPDADTQ